MTMVEGQTSEIKTMKKCAMKERRDLLLTKKKNVASIRVNRNYLKT